MVFSIHRTLWEGSFGTGFRALSKPNKKTISTLEATLFVPNVPGHCFWNQGMKMHHHFATPKELQGQLPNQSCQIHCEHCIRSSSWEILVWNVTVFIWKEYFTVYKNTKVKIKNAGWLVRSGLTRMVSSKIWKEGIWTVDTEWERTLVMALLMAS